MPNQSLIHRYSGELPEADNSSPPASAAAYYADGHRFAAHAHPPQAEQEAKQGIEHTDWWSTGILHDFNNLLAIILSHSSIALAKLPTDHPAHRYVERAVRATKRAADTSSQLLLNASHQWAEPVLLDLNRVIMETVDLLEPRLVAKAEVKQQLKPNLRPVLANLTQIQQVLMNLLLNAAEAIEQTPGRITISTGEITVAEARPPISLPNLPAGHYVYFQLADTGVGMDQTTIDRIFEAHFTTKPIGTGIGLTATLAIIQMHKGAIRVFSTPGRGTTFQVFLPVTRGDSSAHAEFD